MCTEPLEVVELCLVRILERSFIRVTGVLKAVLLQIFRYFADNMMMRATGAQVSGAVLLIG